MKELRSYSSPYNYGHKALAELFDGHGIVIQEKIDGSQFSFGVRYGELFCRSRNQMIDLDNPGMFDKGVKTVKRLFDKGKIPEWHTFRGEYLRKPKHNTLKYSRVPDGNIILFDVDIGNQDYLHPIPNNNNLGLEVVPTLDIIVNKPSLDYLKSFLERESCLGGVKIEGIVLKNYARFDTNTKKVLMAKLVSKDFREKHEKEWKTQSNNNILLQIADQYATEARWRKGVQHLREAGMLEEGPRDIGNLMKEISQDFESECKEEVKEKLYAYFRKKILKSVTRGVPEWYKRSLMENE